MGKVQELGIKNRTYYFFNDTINIKRFHSNLLKIDKKPYKDFDIYYIGYITIAFNNSFGTGYFKENNGEKYLIFDPTEKYEEVFSGIKSEIETINTGEEMYYEKNYDKIGVNTDNDVPLNKSLKFPSLTIIIRCIFQNGKKLCPQIYLDEYLYEL